MKKNNEKKQINAKSKNTKTIVIIIVASLITAIIVLCILFANNGSGNNINNANTKNNSKITYSCNEGYDLNDNNKCIKEIESIAPIVNYSCNSGYELKNDTCVRYEKQQAQAKWSCPSGYGFNKDIHPDLCSKVIKESVRVQMYYCSSGYTLNGTKCIKQSTISPTTNYVCTNNATYNPSTRLCHLIGVYSSCPSGTSVYSGSGNNKTCVSSPFISYDCPSGSTKSGNSCVVSTETIDAYTLRGCNSGYEISSDGETCTKIDYEVPSYKLYCNSGYTLQKETCVKTISVGAKKDISCNGGYELVSDKCVKYDIQEPIKSNN